MGVKCMHVSLKMLAPDLRWPGVKLRLFGRYDTPARFRQLQAAITRQVYGQAPQDPAIVGRTVWLPRRDGGRLRVCVYRPRELVAGQPVTGLLWLYGGGYAFGLPEAELPLIERLIQTSPTVVVVPEYRRSFTAPFPAALHDAEDTLTWMAANTEDLGIRSNQLFVGGESSGGGLACGLTAVARDRGTVPIACQIPLYPMLDDRRQSASARDNDAPVWDAKSSAAAWRLYLGEQFGTDRVSPYAAPARLATLAGLPPAISFVGDVEPFYDETRHYFERLRMAGVAADLAIYPGAFHCFDQMAPGSREAQAAIRNLLVAYRRATQTYFT